jgi:hypothetical protein
MANFDPGVVFPFGDPGIMIPLGAFLMAIILVGISTMRKMREKELLAHQELRIREMEHERKMKELEIEKAKIELERAQISKVQ